MIVNIRDDPEAVLMSSPTFPPVLKPKPRFEVTLNFSTVGMDHELFDLLFYGQSPGPHIVLGEN